MLETDKQNEVLLRGKCRGGHRWKLEPQRKEEDGQMRGAKQTEEEQAGTGGKVSWRLSVAVFQYFLRKLMR